MPEQLNPDEVPETEESDSATVNDVLLLLEEVQLTVEVLLRMVRIFVLFIGTAVLTFLLIDTVFA